MLWKHNRQKVKCLRQDNKHRCEKGLCSLPGYISVCVKRCGMYEESRPFSQGFIFQQLFSLWATEVNERHSSSPQTAAPFHLLGAH